MSYVELLLSSSSLEALNIKNNERRYFALHPETGKAIVPKNRDVLKNLILNNKLETKE